MSAGIGMDVSTNELSNHSLLGVDMVLALPHNTTHNVAMWFTWGDLGYTGVKTTCGNKYCCNPFHLIPQHVGVFVDQESYMESFELACQLHTLKQQVAEYMIEEALKEQQRIDESEEIDARADLILNPDTEFGDRFEAVMTDLLKGQHITQTEPDQPGLFRKPTENTEEDPNQEF